MIDNIEIQNFKSISKLNLEIGRVNVLIGANGSGKSNILEAIALGAASTSHELSREFLSARGIRVTEPNAMRSGFDMAKENNSIKITFNEKETKIPFELKHSNEPFSDWNLVHDKELLTPDTLEQLEQLVLKLQKDTLEKKNFNSNDKKWLLIDDIIKDIQGQLPLIETRERLKSFLIYAPENTFLRKFEEESQIEPLGIKGEGLFKLISTMQVENKDEFQELVENLHLIDWFDGFEIPNDLKFTEKRIRVKDRFLEEGLESFDQRSANEGFLFLLFYFALFISKYTPKFFAIDNIDSSLNPKLCSELIKTLVKLAKKYDKQVIFTTHNPAILDGLNLNDEDQRLLVVFRNMNGHTKIKRVLKRELPEGSTPIRLSEQFLRGYLGGLPKSF
ncbi:AAA family ATPase [Flectobacillus roseus]|uniref:AAA family ATPase n=1 Tax=Flectobacillus roseus TaxID=502259 RepID=A0ABT6Y2L4_9BACT|nr:AAA family ATPase [Flectobacillus roseus]MDI9857800.1 AAA family ATPase [Flectobacillus roseus]